MRPRLLESSSSAGRLGSADRLSSAGTDTAADAAVVRMRSPWAQAALIVAGTRIVFSLAAYAGSFLLSGHTFGLPATGFFDLWVHWDATRFLVTADVGYEGPGSFLNSYAFFPFFPLTVRALGVIGIPGPLAGLLISLVSSWIALTFLIKLAGDDAGPRAGRRAAIYLAVFPTAVFLIAPYSEALFLAGAIPAFYHARRARWELVGVPAAIAMGTRFAGIFLLLGLAVEALRQRDLSLRDAFTAGLAVIMGLLPLLGYAAFLARVKGDPFYFVTDQRLGWGRTFVGPVAAFRNTIDRWDDPTQSTSFLIAYRIEVVAALIGIAFVLWALRKREWGYAVFMGSLLGVLLTSTEYFSVPRILLTFFPAFVFLAQATLTRPRLHEAYLMTSTTVAALGVIVYTRGAWFF